MIYVFKTSVDSASKFESASALLHELLPDTLWNFDLEDCDKILRVEGSLIPIHCIIELLYKMDFLCERIE